MSTRQKLQSIYQRLFDYYGPQHWWPADEPFEVIIGAILTQSTAWVNVEKAIHNLKQAGVLDPESITRISESELAELVRPSGYYNVKANKIKAFVDQMKGYASLENMLSPDVPQLREELLSIYGVGQETADSIILYAAEKPVFVIDAYTHRIMERLGMNPSPGDYAALQSLFMTNLPHQLELFNEYHALLVQHGKHVCKKKQPLCWQCCLNDMCTGV